MGCQRSRDTVTELMLRRELHRLGLRYRLHVRPLPGIRREADIVFGPAKVAVMVDGCFWHGCPVHGTWPKTNSLWWATKLTRNIDRDRDTDTRFEAAGWSVVRVWEHEPAEEAALRVATKVAERRPVRLARWPGGVVPTS
jgi:DNA mismatch endonuclease (patch repair protein)